MIDWLKTRLIEIVTWIGQLWVAVFEAAWNMLRDLFSWGLDAMLGIAVNLANSLDTSYFQQYANSWADLPSEIFNVMGLLGAGQASVIIITAVGIRLLLQLVPFTRLGS